jgi:hypothetical protein
VGQWVHELQTTCENFGKNSGSITLDLERLSFISIEGLVLLKNLAAQNIAFANPTPFVREQLKGAGLVRGS